MTLRSRKYFVKETFNSIKRNQLMSFASISTVALSLLVLGLFLLMVLNANNLAQYLENQVQVTVYMQDGIRDDTVQAAQKKIASICLKTIDVGLALR